MRQDLCPPAVTALRPGTGGLFLQVGRRGLAGIRDVAPADAAEPYIEQQRGNGQSQQQADPYSVRSQSEGESEEVGARQADDVVGDA